jgi:hypothetical protein
VHGAKPAPQTPILSGGWLRGQSDSPQRAASFASIAAWVADMGQAGVRRPGDSFNQPRGGTPMVRGLLGLLIVVAIVLFLVKVAVAGGIVGLIALILLVLIVLGRV